MSSPTIRESGFDALPLQVAVVDQNGVIVDTNRAWRRYADWEPDADVADPVGSNYIHVCRAAATAATDEGRSHAADGGAVTAGTPDSSLDGTVVADGLEAVLAGDRETFDHEYPCHSPAEQRWFLARVSAFEYEGTPHAQVVHLDITDRKRAEQRLEAQNDRLETLADVLSHDLRNPLNVVLGRVELLTERLDATDDGRSEPSSEGHAGATVDDNLASIRSSATRIEDIITDALRLARGRITDDDRPTVVSLGDRARVAWGHVQADEARLEVVDSFRFTAQEGPLGQVLENLFRNAVDHVGPDVTVTVGAIGSDQPGGSHVGFYVADDGPGIPPEERESVFDPGHSTHADGTGLGLAIVERFSESQGWRTDITRAAGGGTRIEIRGVDAA